MPEEPAAVTEQSRQAWAGPLIVNVAFSLPITRDNLELCSRHPPPISSRWDERSSPTRTLVRRLELDAPLNPADEAGCCCGADPGCMDYPPLGEAA